MPSTASKCSTSFGAGATFAVTATVAHGYPIPKDNVRFLQRRAEHTALTKLLDTLRAEPGGAVQGAGCGAAPNGPVPLTLGLDRHRRTRP
ncbi:hypothetical protein [Kitasatospora sp. NPDC093102]|uniref:hypothetical protein n=1 Tax=Kitasatospora sp. NPDC093102 TaxID=3155069 RepID=UPI00341DA1C7